MHETTDSNNNSNKSNFAADPPKTFEQFLQLSQMVSTLTGMTKYRKGPQRSITHD